MVFERRYAYRGFGHRPKGAWPNGRGLAVYVALNVEHYLFGEGSVENLVPDMPQPDVLNTSWRDYGTRVGAWYLLDLFRELELPATILLNSMVCDACPDLVARMVADGHEIAAHGRTNSESQAGLAPAAERALVVAARDRIAAATGTRPTGWLGPWLAETVHTPDLLAETGFRYVLDYAADDQPMWLATRRGRLLALPYSQEINDSVAVIGRRVGADAFADMIVDQVEEMRRPAAERPLVFGLALHANIVGQPFRLRHLRRALGHLKTHADEVWITRADAIADAVQAAPAPFD